MYAGTHTLSLSGGCVYNFLPSFRSLSVSLSLCLCLSPSRSRRANWIFNLISKLREYRSIDRRWCWMLVLPPFFLFNFFCSRSLGWLLIVNTFSTDQRSHSHTDSIPMYFWRKLRIFETQKRLKIVLFVLIKKYCGLSLDVYCIFARRTKCSHCFSSGHSHSQTKSEWCDVDSSTVTWRMKANFRCTSFSTRDSCHLKIENRVTLRRADWLTMTTVFRLSFTMCTS